MMDTPSVGEKFNEHGPPQRHRDWYGEDAADDPEKALDAHVSIPCRLRRCSSASKI
jgi:hypothetical protein